MQNPGFCMWCGARLSFDKHGAPVAEARAVRHPRSCVCSMCPPGAVHHREQCRVCQQECPDCSDIARSVQEELERIQRELSYMYEDGCDIEDALNRASLWTQNKPKPAPARDDTLGARSYELVSRERDRLLDELCDAKAAITRVVAEEREQCAKAVCLGCRNGENRHWDATNQRWRHGAAILRPMPCQASGIWGPPEPEPAQGEADHAE